MNLVVSFLLRGAEQQPLDPTFWHDWTDVFQAVETKTIFTGTSFVRPQPGKSARCARLIGGHTCEWRSPRLSGAFKQRAVYCATDESRQTDRRLGTERWIYATNSGRNAYRRAGRVAILSYATVKEKGGKDMCRQGMRFQYSRVTR